MPVLAGMLAKKVLNASRPPAEAPRTTTMCFDGAISPCRVRAYTHDQSDAMSGDTATDHAERENYSSAFGNSRSNSASGTPYRLPALFLNSAGLTMVIWLLLQCSKPRSE